MGSRWIILGLLSLWLWLPAVSSSALPLNYAPAPADNPLKGFMPYAGSYDFPHSMEWTYFPLKDVQVGIGEFRWAALDKLLNSIASRGHQAIFRTYLDYPNTPYGVPAFLSSVPKRAYTDYDNGKSATSFSPEYDHPDLRRALTNYIAELGARYDGDPRIGFITVGLLGFWGEWHTYPHIGGAGEPDWFASSATQREVLDAFAAAFHKTKFLVREPKPGLDFRQWPMGYHDDSFAFQTLGPEDWHFWPTIQAAGLTSIWKTQPIGGEVRPEIQTCMWAPDAACVPTGQAFATCVSTTHASWMLNQGVFGKGLQGDARDRAIEGARSMGYSLHVSDATWASRVTSNSFTLTATVTNSGVAPFYYPWRPRIGLLARTSPGPVALLWTNDWDITTVLPRTTPRRFTNEIHLNGVPAGDYRLLMQIPNPLPNGKPVRFANQTQDSVLPGWLTLGDLRLGGAPAAKVTLQPAGNVVVQFEGLIPGVRYALLGSTSLSSADWETITEWTASDAVWIWEPPTGAEGNPSRRFVRLIEIP